ncbi:MAG: hypothetical protein MI892_07120 [Desulfobacterales bacterium]|nr:hypothetical protein [Desulfobacterales bacterium]
MIDLLLQIWGGMFYLLNKLFFNKAERSDNIEYQQKWRLWAWSFYLTGLPAWIFIFISERNWIAAAVESSGVPAMLIGLSAAWKGRTQIHGYGWLDHIAKLMVCVGLGLSFYDFGGLVTLNQLMELGIAVGFLMGTYFLAKEKAQGYFWLMVGNLSAALLMMRQGYYLLMVQQFFSFSVVIDAYRIQIIRAKEKV